MMKYFINKQCYKVYKFKYKQKRFLKYRNEDLEPQEQAIAEISKAKLKQTYQNLKSMQNLYNQEQVQTIFQCIKEFSMQKIKIKKVEKICKGAPNYAEINKLTKRINALLSSPQINREQTSLKASLQLFYQNDRMKDFDPEEQWEKIAKVHTTQQQFCQILNQVLIKNTKKFFTRILNYKDARKQQTTNSPNEEVQRRLIYSGLNKTRLALYDFEPIMYRMIQLHNWKCQAQGNCQDAYMDGLLVKILFKKFIGVDDRMRNELLYILNSDQPEYQKQAEALKEEIMNWGPELLEELIKEKAEEKSFDQKPSSDIKFFICTNCYCKQNNIELPGTKKKKKNKRSKKTKMQKSQNTQQKDIQFNWCKDNTILDGSQNSTSQQADPQAKLENQKKYQKIHNMLQDLKIDPQNRIQIRLNLRGEDQQQESTLMKRVRILLHKQKK